jgi:UTP--glucose-1-phosphate uridylyltransferase
VPKGFGDAVLRAKSFINEVFLVHAGDTYIFSSGNNQIQELVEKHECLKADATMLVREVKDPRIYGVIRGDEIEAGTYKLKKAVEKPEKPPTNLAIMPIYVFSPVIFKALEATTKGKGGEIQLTDGIQKMIDWGLNVYAVKLPLDNIIVDIGNPESCWEAFNSSYQNLKKNKSSN